LGSGEGLSLACVKSDEEEKYIEAKFRVRAFVSS
jgi:hypothetical protein